MKSIYTQKITEENLIQYLPDVNMSDRDKEIVKRFIEEKTTFNRFGQEYGLSGERIRQIVERFSRKAHRVYEKKMGDI